jgi:hypothetical protein
VLRIDIAAIVGHMFLWGFLAWVVAGYRQTLGGKNWSGFGLPCPRANPRRRRGRGRARPPRPALLAFVAVRFRYLFGGAPLVRRRPT